MQSFSPLASQAQPSTISPSRRTQKVPSLLSAAHSERGRPSGAGNSEAQRIFAMRTDCVMGRKDTSIARAAAIGDIGARACVYALAASIDDTKSPATKCQRGKAHREA